MPDVEFRGTKDGVVLSVAVGKREIDDIVEEVKAKLDQASAFFGKGPIGLGLKDVSISSDDLKALSETVAEAGFTVGRIIAAGSSESSAADGISDSSASSIELEEGLQLASVVRKTLRSGQRHSFAGSVVVLGDVNPGAEVVALGDIVVFGALRGLAHAGANGDTTAVVAALRLVPTQLRVAGLIARSPDAGPKASSGPEVARIVDGSIVIEAFSPSAVAR